MTSNNTYQPTSDEIKQNLHAFDVQIKRYEEQIVNVQRDLDNAKILVEAGYKPFTSLWWEEPEEHDALKVTVDCANAEVYFLDKPAIAINNYLPTIEHAHRVLTSNLEVLKEQRAEQAKQLAQMERPVLTLVEGTDYTEIKQEEEQKQ
jgi:hypothetical protein